MSKLTKAKLLRFSTLFQRWQRAEERTKKAYQALNAFRLTLAKDCEHPKKYVTKNRLCLICHEVT